MPSLKNTRIRIDFMCCDFLLFFLQSRTFFQYGGNPGQTLVAVESAPVLKMILTPNQKGLWVSTSESNVKYWDISNVDCHSGGGGAPTATTATSPSEIPSHASARLQTMQSRSVTILLMYVTVKSREGLWYVALCCGVCRVKTHSYIMSFQCQNFFKVMSLLSYSLTF